MDKQIKEISTIDMDVAVEMLDRESKDRIRVAKAHSGLKHLGRAGRRDYLKYLYLCIKKGNGDKIEGGWSNFMFDSMYLVDKDTVYTGSTYGSSAITFLIDVGAYLEVKNLGHETILDMDAAGDDQKKIRVPKECYKAYQAMKDNLWLYENTIFRYLCIYSRFSNYVV